MDAVTLLKRQMDEAWDLVSRGMTDVDDAMLHWKPVTHGCWELRKVSGRWQPDYHDHDPHPKTIGWLASHLAACKEMYYDYGFGKARKTWDELEIPGDAEGLRGYLSRTHEPLRLMLDGLREEELDRNTLTNWGEEKPVWWILWIMAYHDVEHGGQIWQVKNECIVSRG